MATILDSEALVPVGSAPLQTVDARSAAERLVEAFLSGRAKTTLRAYQGDISDFRRFVGAETNEEAAELLLSRGHGGANELALRYRGDLLERGLAAATVNRRLAALRSVVKLARVLGMVPWSLEVPSVESQPYRDTRGPGAAGFRLLLGGLSSRSDAKGARDSAILRLLFDLGLRRIEVSRLDVEDVDLEAGRIFVLGKKRREKEPLTLPEPTAAAVSKWLAARGSEPGPLFVNLDRARDARETSSRRLSTTSVYRVVRKLGRETGIKARPHGLRHAAITEALEATGGNVRAVQRFSRHRDLRVLNLYDDNRADLGGDVARLVASAG